MEKVTFKGNMCHTSGVFPAIGDYAPAFHLTGKHLSDIYSRDFEGKRIVLNIFPSLDTDVCARSVRRFNKEASKMVNTQVICVSMDLPFAMERFCSTEGIKRLITASAFRSPLFGQEYGVRICDGPLAGLLARAVIIIDKDQRVIYSQLVKEISHEPDYDEALAILS